MDVLFERVIITEGDVKKTLTYEQFMALPLHQRVQHLMDRAIAFYTGVTEIDRRVVLRSLMKKTDDAG